MSELTGTFTCPLCGWLIDVTVAVSTVLIEMTDGLSFTTVAAPEYSHTCSPPETEAADG